MVFAHARIEVSASTDEFKRTKRVNIFKINKYENERKFKNSF